MVSHQKRLSRLLHDRLGHPHFGQIEIQQITVPINRRNPYHRKISLEVLKLLYRQFADQPAIFPPQRASRHDHLAARIIGQDIGDIHVIGDYRQIAVAQQLTCNGLGRGAKVEDHAGIVGDMCGTGATDRGLGGCVQARARGIFDIGHTAACHRSAMHPVQMSGGANFGQIAAHGLNRYAKALRQIFDSHPARSPRDGHDFALPESHVRYSSFGEYSRASLTGTASLSKEIQGDGMIYDIFIIGGGINGCGIARDAAGRGLSVVLAEQNDLASATSSASTKLFHGGLRYLEYFEFGLVRKALIERETLLVAMPHISWPMRFVLPLHPGMRFDTTTPTSRLLPFLRGKRPAWLIRLGLFLYDHLGGRKILPATSSLDLTRDVAGKALKPEYKRAFEYSDAWVDDARLTVLNARDAQERGARIMTRTRAISARREGDLWAITTQTASGQQTHRARALVNAGGPWVAQIIHEVTHTPGHQNIRLVRGSHIVTRKLYDHDRCYFFQGHDGRIIFAIPYEQDFTLIGTTDVDHADLSQKPCCTEAERDYLCAFASQYFEKPVTPDQVVWTYSGIRPLYDDGATSASAATRDYVLSLDDKGAPLLNIFGGKITTYRKLAEGAMAKLGPFFEGMKPDWTARVPLAGGNFPHDGVAALAAELRKKHSFLTDFWATRLIRAYGTEAVEILGGATTVEALGRSFGATLTEAELGWLIAREYAKTAEDVVWRRSKLGLRMTPGEIEALAEWMQDKA